MQIHFLVNQIALKLPILITIHFIFYGNTPLKIIILLDEFMQHEIEIKIL